MFMWQKGTKQLCPFELHHKEHLSARLKVQMAPQHKLTRADVFI